VNTVKLETENALKRLQSAKDKEKQQETALKMARTLSAGGEEAGAVILIDDDSDNDVVLVSGGGAGSAAGGPSAAPSAGNLQPAHTMVAISTSAAVPTAGAGSTAELPPLPMPWTRYVDPKNGNVFFHNTVTKVSTFYSPLTGRRE
jgi:hypothetical protein